MGGMVGVRIHLVPHLRHVHIVWVPEVRITIVGVWLRLIRHDVRVQTRVLHAIAGPRVDVRWGGSVPISRLLVRDARVILVGLLRLLALGL